MVVMLVVLMPMMMTTSRLIMTISPDLPRSHVMVVMKLMVTIMTQ